MQDISHFIQQHSLLALSTLFIIFALTVLELIKAKRQAVSLAPNDVIQQMNHYHAVIVDTRPKAAFDQGHIIGAMNWDAQQLQLGNKKLEKYRNKPIILVCDTGTDSKTLAMTLRQAGFETYSLSDGMTGWVKSEMPVVHATSSSSH